MGPDGFTFYQGSIEHEPAEIIDRSDEIPFFSRSRRPEMVGGIVLNKFSGVMRQHLAVVGLVDFSFKIKAAFFSFRDNGG